MGLGLDANPNNGVDALRADDEELGGLYDSKRPVRLQEGSTPRDCAMYVVGYAPDSLAMHHDLFL
jgi:hypothetical protein